MTDYTRWSQKTSFSSDWAKRAKFISSLVPKNLKILDLGCGLMDVEKYCLPSEYLPADLFQRDHRTNILDLNTEEIPAELLEKAELVTMLGVIEYLENIDKHLEKILLHQKVILFTYCATDTHPTNKIEDRHSTGWINSYSTDDLYEKLKLAGFEVIYSGLFENEQRVFLATPPRKPEWLINHINEHTKETLKTPPEFDQHPAERKSLILGGFWGRGNCGDEALLQCIYETFSNTFDIRITVDGHGAYKGFWDWYPYNEAKIFHQCATEIYFNTPNEIAGLLIGGGGLPLGFLANQLFAANANNIPCIISGVDSWGDKELTNQNTIDAASQYLKLFRLASFRNENAKFLTQFYDYNRIHFGADWALKLISDSSSDIFYDNQRALIILREYPKSSLHENYITYIKKIINITKLAGYKIILLPFCPEDTRFLQEIEIHNEYPVVELWSNPRKMQQYIENSGLVISIGRLHPLIFAANVNTPVVSIHSPELNIGSKGDKLETMSEELGIAMANTEEKFIEFLKNPHPADNDKVKSAKIKLDQTIKTIKDELQKYRDITETPK